MTQAQSKLSKSHPHRGLSFIGSLLRHRELWWRLSEREVIGRYRGSILGWGWSLLTPPRQRGEPIKWLSSKECENGRMKLNRQ